jgi:hypothetical protein
MWRKATYEPPLNENPRLLFYKKPVDSNLVQPNVRWLTVHGHGIPCKVQGIFDRKHRQKHAGQGVVTPTYLAGVRLSALEYDSDNPARDTDKDGSQSEQTAQDVSLTNNSGSSMTADDASNNADNVLYARVSGGSCELDQSSTGGLPVHQCQTLGRSSEQSTNHTPYAFVQENVIMGRYEDINCDCSEREKPGVHAKFGEPCVQQGSISVVSSEELNENNCGSEGIRNCHDKQVAEKSIGTAGHDLEARSNHGKPGGSEDKLAAVGHFPAKQSAQASDDESQNHASCMTPGGGSSQAWADMGPTDWAPAEMSALRCQVFTSLVYGERAACRDLQNVSHGGNKRRSRLRGKPDTHKPFVVMQPPGMEAKDDTQNGILSDIDGSDDCWYDLHMSPQGFTNEFLSCECVKRKRWCDPSCNCWCHVVVACTREGVPSVYL